MTLHSYFPLLSIIITGLICASISNITLLYTSHNKFQYYIITANVDAVSQYIILQRLSAATVLVSCYSHHPTPMSSRPPSIMFPCSQTIRSQTWQELIRYVSSFNYIAYCSVLGCRAAVPRNCCNNIIKMALSLFRYCYFESISYFVFRIISLRTHSNPA